MKIFLVYLVLDTQQNTGYNTGLGYISATLSNAGYKTSYFILKQKKDIDIFYEQIRKHDPRIIAFSTTTSQFKYILEISNYISKISSAFTVCGGIHPTLVPECITQAPKLNAIARGEGEYAMLDLANAIHNEEDYLSIDNFWFNNKGSIVKNKIRPLINDLDELPFPDKSSLDYQKVINKGYNINRVIFSRGCPFKCTYCSNTPLIDVYPKSTGYFRQRSPQKAIQELELDAKRFSFNKIYFDDDTMSLNKKWFYEFFNLYKEKFDYPFRCNLRIGTFDEDMIILLKEAGATNVGIGIEHGNENFRRDVLKRNMSNDQIKEAFRLCDKHNLTHDNFIMVGFPYETKELFFDTVKLCREINASGPASIFQPYPGTELSKICEQNNWLPDKQDYKEREEAVIDFPDMSKDEIQLYSKVFPYLTKYKYLPLNISFKLIIVVFGSFDLLKKTILYIPKRLNIKN